MFTLWVRFLIRIDNITGGLTEFVVEGGYEFLMQNCTSLFVHVIGR